MGNKIKILDYVVITLSLFSIIGLLFNFLNILSPPSEYGTKNYDPFYQYYTNNGIIAIYIVKAVLWVSFAIIGIRWIKAKQISKTKLSLFLVILLIIALVQWFELWYGSTFYYGEVRDKQGLGIPILSMLLVSYSIARLNIKKTI